MLRRGYVAAGIVRGELREDRFARHSAARDAGATRRERRDPRARGEPAAHCLDRLGVVTERDDPFAPVNVDESREERRTLVIRIRIGAAAREERVNTREMPVHGKTQIVALECR
jgi:hypothetical protein